MKNGTLGKNLEVLAIGLGCMGMSFSYGPPKDKKEMITLLRALPRESRCTAHVIPKGWNK